MNRFDLVGGPQFQPLHFPGGLLLAQRGNRDHGAPGLMPGQHQGQICRQQQIAAHYPEGAVLNPGGHLFQGAAGAQRGPFDQVLAGRREAGQFHFYL